VGLTNIMAEVHESWASASWEAIAAQDPDVLVLVDSSWNSVEHKIEVLESNPVTATITAVQQQRYVVQPLPASEARVRSVRAAVGLSDQLRQLASADVGQSGQQ